MGHYPTGYVRINVACIGGRGKSPDGFTGADVPERKFGGGRIHSVLRFMLAGSFGSRSDSEQCAHSGDQHVAATGFGGGHTSRRGG